ncbi:MAG: cell filamentation protein Fic [Cyclobacterium sp.]|nr:cell filamentation protein Fic [Cyclobacterium sp.]
MKETTSEILTIIQDSKKVSRQEIGDRISFSSSAATLKRIIQNLLDEGWICSQGKGKATAYLPSSKLELSFPIDLDAYFLKEQDERIVKNQFDFEIFEKLEQIQIFSSDEISAMEKIHELFKKRVCDLTPNEYQKEMERLAIDLSWKSSQIEGNTYSLLETEILLKEKKTASGKTIDEATMLLNHKEAIDFLETNKDYAERISVRAIEDLHRILIEDPGIGKNIRRRRVGITGTNYQPLDNEFQIREALEKTCQLINSSKIGYEKAFLALLLISYIQPFADGNKRTARIFSNAILLAYAHCPISFRTVDPLDYKKAMLVFYEQTNLSPIKRIFIEQAEFAVNTYF